MKKKVISIVGARPNFMKIAPVHQAFRELSDRIDHRICHTGQHYDNNMSKVFFREFGIGDPDLFLGVGGGTHAVQTARIMTEFEKVCLEEKPDMVIVVGDVNSTLACGIVSKKLHIPLVHIEAGLRSFDRTMPEEINRIVVDRISDYLFVTEKSGLDNLRNEGVPDSAVFFTGNVMIDCLISLRNQIDRSDVAQTLGLNPGNFILVTLHRPSNVDDPERLAEITGFLNDLGSRMQVVFPIHPRTRKNMEENSLQERLSEKILLTDPLGYLDFQNLVKNSRMVVTDSGGIQEETTYLGIPCITIRESTERPVTVDIGSNFLVGTSLEKALETVDAVLEGKTKKGRIPDLWDGNAANRIVTILGEILSANS
jgi:UDP-N-acetylglucosamine 2-epimerase (non-hydrolysing)